MGFLSSVGDAFATAGSAVGGALSTAGTAVGNAVVRQRK